MTHLLRRAARGLALILVAAHGAGAAPCLAQKAPVKWGDVPEEHLRMTHYPADTNAAAVILADYGTVEFDPDYSLTFRRHRRVKILREDGYDWGTVVLAYRSADRMQNVSEVRGQTFAVGADGKVKRLKMDKSAVFREDVDGEYKQVRFTLPGLAPGAVIEYQYTLRSNSPVFVPEWQFQNSEPTLWSEFRPEFPPRLGFVQAVRGVLDFHIDETQEILRPDGTGTRRRIVMRDVPALREEAYMTTPQNFRARIEYQLASYFDPRSGPRQFLQTWDELAKTLIENNAFGRQLDRPRRNVREQVEALTAGLTEPEAKLQTLYDYVRTQVAFDGKAGIFLDRDLDDVLKTRKGSSPEIALLLVSMLREAGLEAYPVLISTRSHGYIIEQYPLLRQFNDVIVYAQAGGETFLLDATDPLRPYDLLPYEALNERGWLVRKTDARWIDVTAAGRYTHLTVVAGELAADGTLTAVLDASDGGYSALYKRRRLKEDGAEKLVRNVFLDGLHDVRLDAHHVAHADSVTLPLKTTADFAVPAYAQAAGDFLYLNPTVLGRTEENPLKLPERTFPVDYGYPADMVYQLRLKLPDGYEVREKPSAMRLALSSGGMTFTREADVQDGELVLQTRFVRAKSLFAPRHYDDLRDFYDRVVAAHAEQIVLKRTSVAAEGN